MDSDEAAIRQLIETWLAATAAGDLDTVLGLMAEDVVFLLPGQQSMVGREAFAAASRAMTAKGAPRFEGKSEVDEVNVLGDWAFVRARLAVTLTPPDGGAAVKRAGFTLSILKRERGRWVIARDANMLSPVAG